MNSVDRELHKTCELIDKNIKVLAGSEDELLAENVVSFLRNLLEHIALKIYSNGKDIPVDYPNIQAAIKHIKSKEELKWLSRFHCWTQQTISHYTPGGEISYRLMVKYYEWLIRAKQFMREKYNLEILKNLNQFPINRDSELKEYYERIIEKINDRKPHQQETLTHHYINGAQPFVIDGNIYYQVTLTIAHNRTSKFDRIIAFTNLDIPRNYAIKPTMRIDKIEIFKGVKMPIKIIDDYKISIRLCEIDNFAGIFNITTRNQGSGERRRLMEYLTHSNQNLVDLMDMTEDAYCQVKSGILNNHKPIVFSVLDECRRLIKDKKPGRNLIRYLLFTMNNRIIKKQVSCNPCEKLSRLHLEYGCIPFDKMPFCSSLIGHNPKVLDLFECLDSDVDRSHEHLAKIIKNNTEINGHLYMSIEELKETRNFNNIDNLIGKYNSCLYPGHKPQRELKKYKNHIYLHEYEEDAKEIIRSLEKLTSDGVLNYESSVDNHLRSPNINIDCDQKREFLKKAFSQSKVIALYGAAGTGKTTFIKHLSDFFHRSAAQHFLANTNSAVDNLKRRISSEQYSFQTIESYKNRHISTPKPVLLVIDECSTVSNADMRKILEKESFYILVLVGDIYQIEPIRFGNWFDIIKKALPKHSVFELSKTYRTTEQNLLKLWDVVRSGSDDIAEHVNRYSSPLTEDFFKPKPANDEIVLSLNYSGLYGINSVNDFLQSNNNNSEQLWGTKTYKIGDPILFNENNNNRFSPLIYNNCKGRIVGIDLQNEKITFDVELENTINEIEAQPYDFELLPNANNNFCSTIRFSVSKNGNTDEDDDSLHGHVPFHVAYAVSIHKAQGLEYESVKLVISDDMEEQITHNIFYTAITRAKKTLKIYWTPEIQNKVLQRMRFADNRKDWHLLSSKMQGH